MAKLNPTNKAQLVAVFGALANVAHPQHGLALDMVEDFCQDYHKEQTRRLATMMQDQLDGMDVYYALSDFRAQTN